MEVGLPTGAWPPAITRGWPPKALLMIQAGGGESRSARCPSGSIKNFGRAPRWLVDGRVQ